MGHNRFRIKLLIAAVRSTAVQHQRQVIRALIVGIAAVQPVDGGVEVGGLPVRKFLVRLVGRHGIVSHVIGYNPIGQHLPLCIIAGQAAIGIRPQRRLGSIEGRKLVYAKLSQRSLRQFCPFPILRFVLQLEVVRPQCRTGSVVIIHPLDREGVCEVLHVVFGGDRHIGAFHNGTRGLTGLRVRLRPLFGHRIRSIPFVSRNRLLHDLELDARRNPDRGGLGIRWVHGFGDAGLGHCLWVGLGERQLHGEGLRCLIPHNSRSKRQGLGFDCQL